MVIDLRRGLMLLISAPSPTSGGRLTSGGPLTRSSASLSSLCRHSSWQHRPGGSGGRAVYLSAIQQSYRWPIFGINGWELISGRAFHDFPPTAAAGFSGFDEVFNQEGRRAAEKRLCCKKILILGLSRPSGWRQRNQRLPRSVGYRYGNIWGAERGGRGEIFSRALSNSAGEAAQIAGDGPKKLEEIWEAENGDQRGPRSDQGLENLNWEAERGGGRGEIFPRALLDSTGEAAQRAGDGPKTLEEIWEAENGDQRGSRSDQGLENLKGYGSNRSFVQPEGNSVSSQVQERSSRPPFKSVGNYSDKSRGESGDGRSSGGSGRPPATTKPYEKRAQFKGGGDGGSSNATGRSLFEPKANDPDKLSQSRGGEGENGRSKASGKALPNVGSPSFVRLKAWYAANMGPFGGEDSSPVKSSKDLNAENPQPSSETSRDGPQSGYKSRERGTELSKFRWVAGSQNRGSGGRDSHSKRVPLQGSEAVGRQAFPDSSVGRNSFNSKQSSPEEEEVVRNYPLRRLEGEQKSQYSVKKNQLGLAGHSEGSPKKGTPQWANDGIFGKEPQGEGRLEAEEESWPVQGDPLDQGRGVRQNKSSDSSDKNLM